MFLINLLIVILCCEKTGKRERTGTNIANAYSAIYESMKIEEGNNATVFLETQHIVILFTDGIHLSVFTYNLVYKYASVFKNI